MISTYYFLWTRLIQYGAKYQLAAPSVTEFNGILKEVQLEAFNLLAPMYQKNEKIRGILKGQVRQIFDVSDQNGIIYPPQRINPEEQTTETYARVVGMGMTDGQGNLLYSINPASEVEIVEFTRIPQRQPNLTKKRAYYIDYDEFIQLYPKQGLPFAMFYLIYPQEALLAFTYQLVNGEYVQVYDETNTVDLQWDPSAANLLLYMMVEKMGISSRDDLLQEYAQMGIKFALVEPQIEAK